MKFVIILFLGTALAYPTDKTIEKFAISNRQFTGDVYDEILIDNTENVLVSPFSVATILALTQSGAVGVTGEEIRKSLYLPNTKEETEAIIKNVLPTFKNNDYILKTANKIYVEDDFEVKEDFRRVTSDIYQVEFQNIEFAESSAVDTINQWVEEETENKIHDLLQNGDVDESTKVVLINALYFQGNWSFPFEPTFTKKQAFFAPNKKTVDTEIMSQDAKLYNYYESPELDATFVELPFQGQDASMTIILPNEKQGISLLEKQMKNVLVAPQYSQEYVKVFLPKFRIESTIDFGAILEKLGVKAAFDPDHADFSGIAGSPGDLVVNKVTQKTFIDVNEVGVESGVASAVVVGPTSILPPEAVKTFTVDHPFAFYIKVNDVILFEGRVLEPKY